jgi:hypothetical protein
MWLRCLHLIGALAEAKVEVDLRDQGVLENDPTSTRPPDQDLREHEVIDHGLVARFLYTKIRAVESFNHGQGPDGFG